MSTDMLTFHPSGLHQSMEEKRGHVIYIGLKSHMTNFPLSHISIFLI